MTLMLEPGTGWSYVYGRCRDFAPGAFVQEREANHWGGRWHYDGRLSSATSLVNGLVISTVMAGRSRLDASIEHRESLSEDIPWYPLRTGLEGVR